ncbi:hypothetical protein Taro_029999 [Colocasia esculenta]|uniref:Uncharacterized protein n=1 Tax=Colocasia esculenta TaxID=4460 RepID=A0A843VMU8_COLES|nr:hypothetical protein [Colocasia esculenta]
MKCSYPGADVGRTTLGDSEAPKTMSRDNVSACSRRRRGVSLRFERDDFLRRDSPTAFLVCDAIGDGQPNGAEELCSTVGEVAEAFSRRFRLLGGSYDTVSMREGCLERGCTDGVVFFAFCGLSELVDTRDLSQGIDLPVWDSKQLDHLKEAYQVEADFCEEFKEDPEDQNCRASPRNFQRSKTFTIRSSTKEYI